MKVALACFALGLVLMVFDLALWVGVVLLFAFIVRGVFAIADPAHLGRDGDG
jgi:hypothetical protein